MDMDTFFLLRLQLRLQLRLTRLLLPFLSFSSSVRFGSTLIKSFLRRQNTLSTYLPTYLWLLLHTLSFVVLCRFFSFPVPCSFCLVGWFSGVEIIWNGWMNGWASGLPARYHCTFFLLVIVVGCHWLSDGFVRRRGPGRRGEERMMSHFGILRSFGDSLGIVRLGRYRTEQSRAEK